MTNYELDKMELLVDEEGFVLKAKEINGVQATITGNFETHEEIICYKVRKDVLDFYSEQEGVVESIYKGQVDNSPESPILEAVFMVDTSKGNWFDLDHSKFNEVYCK